MAQTKEEKREYLRLYYLANSDKIKLASRVNEAKRREDPATKAKELKRACERQKKYYRLQSQKYSEINKARRLKDPEKTKVKDLESRLKHRDRRLIAGREYYSNFKEDINAKNREKYASDYRGRRSKNIARGREKTKELTDGYILNQLICKGFPKESITKELIETKRIIIKTKRLWKTLRI